MNGGSVISQTELKCVAHVLMIHFTNSDVY